MFFSVGLAVVDAPQAETLQANAKPVAARNTQILRKFNALAKQVAYTRARSETVLEPLNKRYPENMIFKVFETVAFTYDKITREDGVAAPRPATAGSRPVAGANNRSPA